MGIQIPGLWYQAKHTSNEQDMIPSLTSWHLPKPGNYVFDQQRFGRCSVRVPANSATIPAEVEATPSNCVAGGRSGYSVKLIDYNMLFEEMELGGSGVIGRIRNPPPPQ